MVTRNFRFGELETRALFALEKAEASLVTSAELAKMLKISKNRANKLVWQLIRKKRLLRIRRGAFLFAPMKAGPRGQWSEEAFALLSQVMKDKPYYISFRTAMNYYGFTEQIPWITQVVVTQRRRSFEAVGTKYDFIKVDKLGEWQEENIAGKSVKMATREQLIIDCLAHPEYGGGLEEITKALWNARNELDWKKLRTLASKSKDAVRRRLGYLLEVLKLPSFKIKKSSGWRWLDPSSIKTVKGKSAKWGLLLNLTEKELTKWKEIR
ncbi:MAG: type IV toxin-antitoxin system AbiEi family antitoxin [Candidatus Micrarchaeota archaeon]